MNNSIQHDFDKAFDKIYSQGTRSVSKETLKLFAIWGAFWMADRYTNKSHEIMSELMEMAEEK